MKKIVKGIAVLFSTVALSVLTTLFIIKKFSVLETTNAKDLKATAVSLPSYGMMSEQTFVPAAEVSTPTVVHITAVENNKNTSKNNPYEQFFQFGFPQGDVPQNSLKKGTGSGVIITKDGYIVTNHHVVAGADEITVTTYDKQKFNAAIIGMDPSTDIAVLKIEATDLPKISIGNSDDVKVGQWVMAVGNPFDLESTVTAGIVSAKSRNIRIIKEKFSIESFIQTDAVVNPGNSGGALVNLAGELIGINTAIASNTGSYSGYSFAVPSNIALKVVDDLIKYGATQRGILGVQIVNVSDLNESELKEKNISLTEGVFIDGLIKGGSAEKSGLKIGDIIVEAEEKTVKSAPELQAIIGTGRPGDQIDLKVIRAGKIVPFKIILEKAN